MNFDNQKVPSNAMLSNEINDAPPLSTVTCHSPVLRQRSQVDRLCIFCTIPTWSLYEAVECAAMATLRLYLVQYSAALTLHWTSTFDIRHDGSRINIMLGISAHHLPNNSSIILIAMSWFTFALLLHSLQLQCKSS